MSKPLRIVYTAGPGNVIGTFRYWNDRKDDPYQTAITYSGQFYDVCQSLNAKAYVIAHHPEKNRIKTDSFTIEHRPKPFQGASGLMYHLAEVLYGLGIVLSAIRFRAQVVLLSNGTTHWFVVSLLALARIRVIPSLHCSLWRKYLPQKKLEKYLLKMSKSFFSRSCAAIMVVSEEIAKQVSQLTNDQHPPVLCFTPTYRPEQFAQMPPPSENLSPFRVLYVGRIEEDKGVFDLLEVARRFAKYEHHSVSFDLCGEGSALEKLRQAAHQAGLSDRFICHGHCDKPMMYQMYSQCHIVVAPTKSSFLEGFNKVIAEGVLAGRPVIASSVCPAISKVREAVVEIPPDDIDSFYQAIMRLLQDREFYQDKQARCSALQAQFYDPSCGWGFMLKQALAEVIS